MKKQYRIIPDCTTYGFELYHNGELIETKTFYSSEHKEYIENIGNLESSGYIQGYLPEEVQIIKSVYEERLAKVITSEPNKPEQKEEIAEEYIKKEDVLKIIYDIKENKDVPKNYGTLLDIIQRIRNLPPEYAIRLAEIKAVEEIVEMLKKSIKKSVDDAWHSDGNGIYDAENVLDDIDNLVKEWRLKNNAR